MNKRIKLLTLAVLITAILLVLAAVLSVLGIFNGMLGWDIFGPRVEAVLYGLFFSCLSLAAIGLALTIVLGVHEIVKAVVALRGAGQEPETAQATRSAYARYSWWLIGIVTGMSVTVAAFAAVNHTVQIHRASVFKKVALEQMELIEPRIAGYVRSFSRPPGTHVPPDLHEAIRTLDRLSFINRTTLYVADPDDMTVMWGLTAWRAYKEEDGFARFFVAKDFEKAMRSALVGDTRELDRLNAARDFTLYHVVHDGPDRPIAVLRIDGNPRENFREYPLGF